MFKGSDSRSTAENPLAEVPLRTLDNQVTLYLRKHIMKDIHFRVTLLKLLGTAKLTTSF